MMKAVTVPTACRVESQLPPDRERLDDLRSSATRACGVSTDNIGLAGHPEGLTLVRIGKPLRPEFAA